VEEALVFKETLKTAFVVNRKIVNTAYLLNHLSFALFDNAPPENIVKPGIIN
jgi:hypothetical protein